MSHSHNRKTSQPPERMFTRTRAAAPRSRIVVDNNPAPPSKRCDCIAYESADGEEYGACHCGHSVEEHTSRGCEGPAPAKEGA